MNIYKILENDLANGPGLRTTVFCTGCEHHCDGCHAKDLWEFNQGTPLNKQVIKKIVESVIKNKVQRNLSILGGEPFHPSNIAGTVEIAKRVKQYSPYTKIWVWTGYLFEDIETELKKKKGLNYLDVIIDGPFIENLTPGDHKWRGSANQRIWIKNEKGEFQNDQEQAPKCEA